MDPAPILFVRTTLDWARTYVMGVVNVTPDSFSDGGRYADVDGAIAHGRGLCLAGADILDVGGESTRPVGAQRVSVAQECDRVVPVIRALARELDVPVSIDTTKAEVAQAALDAGAEIVNDISGGAFDPRIVDVIAQAGAAFVCGHVRGTNLADVHASERTPPSFDEVCAELSARIAALPETVRRRTIVDPCIGFGKGTPLDVELMGRGSALAKATGCAVLVGPSRKRFLGELTGEPVHQRDGATVGAAIAALTNGAHIVRVHDVKLLRSALSVYQTIVSVGG